MSELYKLAADMMLTIIFINNIPEWESIRVRYNSRLLVNNWKFPKKTVVKELTRVEREGRQAVHAIELNVTVFNYIYKHFIVFSH